MNAEKQIMEHYDVQLQGKKSFRTQEDHNCDKLQH